MGSTPVDCAQLRPLVTDTVLGADFRRATFGGTARGPVPSAWVRVVVRPVELGGQRYLQFAYFEAKKAITKNFPESDLGRRLDEILDVGFARIHLATRSEEVDIHTTKKGKVLIGRRKLEPAAGEPAHAHNRIKQVPLPEGRADRLLEALGVLTRGGHVRPTMRAKYTQINEFLKQLLHLLDDAGLRSLGRPVEILDCGCGSSYLTLAAYHYLNDVLGIPAHLIGVDVNEEVIRKSIERAQRFGAEHLRFACHRIGAVAVKPDLVLALHACDTATDDAIAQAITAEAKLLLSVPCCHHHLNEILRPAGPAEVLRPLLRHGLLQQRTADLVTDAFRALVLRIMGYRADVVEFVSPEHTARNLMIRAVRGASQGEKRFVGEYLEMRRFWGVTPYIEGVLGESFQHLLSGNH
jgi:SAM-dependent methyltransferase